MMSWSAQMKSLALVALAGWALGCQKAVDIPASRISSLDADALGLSKNSLPLTFGGAMSFAAFSRPSAAELNVLAGNGETKIVDWAAGKKKSDVKPFVGGASDSVSILTVSPSQMWMMDTDKRIVAHNANAYEEGAKVDLIQVKVDDAVKFSDHFKLVSAEETQLFTVNKTRLYVYDFTDGHLQERSLNLPVRIDDTKVWGAGSMRENDAVVGYWLMTPKSFYRFNLTGTKGSWSQEILPPFNTEKTIVALSVYMESPAAELVTVLATAAVMTDENKIYDVVGVKKGASDNGDKDVAADGSESSSTSTAKSGSQVEGDGGASPSGSGD